MKKKRDRRPWTRLRKARREAVTGTNAAAAGENRSSPEVNSAGIIRPDDDGSRFPQGFEEAGDAGQPTGIPTVLVVITLLALGFIAIITYFVVRMPPRN